MFELKPLHRDAIPAALDKAMRYRLLNEPGAAESICLDVLKVDPDHQQALVTLLLAMTDRLVRREVELARLQAREGLARCALRGTRLVSRSDGMLRKSGSNSPRR